MAYIRSDISGSSGDFSDPNIVWYAVGVYKMMQRSLSETASWWYFAAIHGEAILSQNIFPNARSWAQIDPPPNVPTSPVPSDTSIWDQCQHATWYFPPWHRGYLIALEAQLRADIISAGGPSDWALPYWNYFNNAQMPKEFGIPTLPQNFPAGLAGQPNPLYVQDRFGPDGDGNVYIPNGIITTDCLQDPDYTNSMALGSFGGGETAFSHFGSETGDLENNPHNLVHVIVGGFQGDVWSDPNADGLKEGLMTDPNLAGLDPIFYMHHGMIDALWADWNVVLGKSNPTDSNWVNGPTPEFSMPWPQQSQPWNFTPGDVTDIQQLNYTYDFLANPSAAVAPFQAPAAPAGPARLAARLGRLGAPKAAAGAIQAPVAPVARASELVGASAPNLPVKNSGLQATVQLDSGVRDNLTASLKRASAFAVPDRVVLKLENVKGTGPISVLDVYVNVPAGDRPGDHPDLKAGSVGLFGLRQATKQDGPHGGGGLSFRLEITDIVDRLHLADALTTESLNVSVVPHRPIPADSDLTVGRISVHRVIH
jgi:tyrosinase